MCFHPLRLCQLSVTNLREFVSLLLYDAEFLFLKHFKSGLIKSFANQNVKHSFSFLVKVEQLVVTIIDLLFFAALLRRLLRVKKQVWRPIHIKISRELEILRRRVVC